MKKEFKYEKEQKEYGSCCQTWLFDMSSNNNSPKAN